MTQTASKNFRWLSGGNDNNDQGNSTKPLFYGGTGHLLFKQASAEISLKSNSYNSNWLYKVHQVSYGPSTVARHPESVAIPRVQKISNPSANRYILLKKYDGYVLSRDATTFMVRLYENSNEYPAIDAEFELEELSETDRDLAVEGAAVVWTIGYHENGPRKRESLVYLRRRPSWNEKETNEANASAEALTSDIGWK